MRILHVVHQYMPERVGGTELYTHWLARTLSRRGHQISIFYRRSAEGVGLKHRAEENVHLWAAWTGLLNPTRRLLTTFRDPPMVRAFERVLEEASPDLVHIQHLMGLPVALIRSIQQQGLLFAVTLWDYWWICANAQLLTNDSQRVCAGPRAYLNCARCALARAGCSWLWPVLPAMMGLLAWRGRLLRQILEAASALIAPTEFVRRWYAAHGVATKRLLVIQPGLERPAWRQQKRPGSDSLVRFAYIGGISEQKGVHTLVEAFSKVRGPTELWIAGDESFAPAYVAGLRALATPNVRFLGRLGREAVWETLSQTDVVVVPSLWYETFSFITSEAFAAGLPVVASCLGPLADRVRDGVDGLLLPPGDVVAWRAALQRLVDEPGLRARLQANVRPPVTLEEHADRLGSLYAQLVNPLA
jgi:glycosyltransferase involved in cell wall biosynthesis